jgi:hypothetical protein
VAQILFAESRRKSTGEPGLTYPAKQTLETYLDNLQMTGNTIVGGKNQWLIVSYFMDRTITDGQSVDGNRGPSYNRFISSLRAGQNTWYSPDPAPFTWNYPEEYVALDYGQFKLRTGQDQTSTFRDPGPVACAMPAVQPPPTVTPNPSGDTKVRTFVPWARR